MKKWLTILVLLAIAPFVMSAVVVPLIDPWAWHSDTFDSTSAEDYTTSGTLSVGYVGSSFYPDTDNAYALGERSTPLMWEEISAYNLYANTLYLGSGTITDTTGAISFGNETLTTGKIIIDITDAEALLVRQNADDGDVFTIDTTGTMPAALGSAPEVIVHTHLITKAGSIYVDSASGTLLLGSTTGEDLTLDFDDTANKVIFGTTTGVTGLDFGSFNIQTTGEIDAKFQIGNSVIVDPCLDDPNEKYDWLASANRNSEMGVLSATNRRVVILAPGTHTLTATLVMDVNFVGISSMVSHGWDTTYLTGSFGSDGKVGEQAVIKQTVNDVRLSGFTTENTYSGANHHKNALVLDGVDNDASLYQNMKFISQRESGYDMSAAVYTINNSSFKGTWFNCVANPDTGHGFRMAGTGTYDPDMWFCVAGDRSFIGTYLADGTIKGKHYYCVGGDRCFGYNIDRANKIDVDALFIGCIAGKGSFATDSNTFATYIDCIGEANSFGGHFSEQNSYGEGFFRGYAQGIKIRGNARDSFGDSSGGFLSGTIVDCIIEGRDVALKCKRGASIRNSRITITANNIDAITLLDSLTVIYNTDLIVNAAGTGTPINASSAMNVVAAHCRMNNADNDADGLDPNVTNLIGTSYNVVDDDIE